MSSLSASRDPGRRDLGRKRLDSHARRHDDATRVGVLVCLAFCAWSSLGCALQEAPALGDPPPAGGVQLVALDQPLEIPQLLSGILAAEQADQMTVPNVNQWPLPIRKLVENGALVQAGQVVVEFDNPNVTNQLERQRVAVLEAASQLENTSVRSEGTIAESELEVARRKAARDKAAIAARIPEGLRSDRERDHLRVDLEKAELELAAARKKLEDDRVAAKADVDIARVDLHRAAERLARTEHWLDELTLHAPRAGYVDVVENRREDRAYQIGDSAWPGDVVASLPILDSLIVRARLFDVDDGTIQPGERADVILDAAPDRRFTGRVRSLQPVAEQDSRRSLRRSFEVLIDLDELDLELMRTGMSAQVIVLREERVPGAVQVARAALEPLEPLDQRRALLYLRDGRREDVELLVCAPLACLVRGVERTIEPGTALAIAAPQRSTEG